ncbi:MAG: hypothetical protein VX017_10315, partial [Pseudomonadota bacterium]|nr:hypothetical protein [Pseudomonadota bacterium]
MQRMRFASVVDGAATGHTPLRYAVMAGRVDLVEQILACMKILANEDSQPVPLDVDAPLAAAPACFDVDVVDVVDAPLARRARGGEDGGAPEPGEAASAPANAGEEPAAWLELELAVTQVPLVGAGARETLASAVARVAPAFDVALSWPRTGQGWVNSGVLLVRRAAVGRWAPQWLREFLTLDDFGDQLHLIKVLPPLGRGAASL